MENIAKTPNSTLAASQEHEVNERVIPLTKFNTAYRKTAQENTNEINQIKQPQKQSHLELKDGTLYNNRN